MAYNRNRKRVGMGLASALEEERLELAAELENRNGTSTRKAPQSQRRSVFDTVPDLGNPTPAPFPPRHGSIAGIGVGVTPPSHRRSLQEPLLAPSPLRSATPPPPPPPTTSTPTTPSTHRVAATTTSRAPPPIVKPKPTVSANGGTEPNGKDKPPEKPRPSIRWDDSVIMSPTANSYNYARRSSQQHERPPSRPQSKNAVAAMMSGLDLSFGLPGFSRGRDSSRNNSKRGASLDSRLPSRKARSRSTSPATRLMSPGPPRVPASTPSSPVMAKAKPYVVETTDLSANKPPSPPPVPPTQEPSDGDTAAKPAPAGDERLAKDVYDSDNNLIETSEDDDDDSSSSSDESSPDRDGDEEAPRGRTKDPGRNGPATTEPNAAVRDSAQTTDNDDDVEDRRRSASAKQGPGPAPTKKTEVHPRTSFDSASATNTPFGSEDEAELSDIKKAQKLSIRMSAIDNSIRSRSIRTIIRGDYANLPEETDGGRRRPRKYMVTTDLSEESVYALEWTIGTILRDGDTMFAVFCLHEETGAQIGEGAESMQDAAAVVGSQTEETVRKSQNDPASNLSRTILGRLGTGTDSRPGSVDARGMSKAESERVHAVEIISQTCVRLLRKTLLQVRVAVEVIHCKSPKNMITEAIDGLDPTLVIVGARGRSALKGVLLGSFSNYLVMHSSVPVMVARRKLKKQSKNKKATVRLSNNLSAPKKLSQAKID
ncbi:universal stress protein family domain protein [Aspergillus candidus]|uniref:UspA domain-containing protein n=1 Tax=Aspergillus candidus TaxID=41067 RepID=A0A2I2FHR2_ASPCN|nr:hypothetical protein BDW47DRAFT_135060 [Aspergillus candidus]PLB40177.1 hypothetical protein BDW47DRAFT_135060 [Aspergillus candidus]